MKILLVGNFRAGWDTSISDENNIADSLQRFGHEVTRLSRDDVTVLPHEGYDFILISQYDHYPEDMFGTPITTVYWAFDYQRDGQEWHERLVNYVDIYLTKRISDVKKYPNAQWLPADFAPAFLNRMEGIEQDIDVLFTGTYLDYAEERNSLLKAVDDNFGLTIHSLTPVDWKRAGFKNVHDVVVDYELPALIARAKINISIDVITETGYWSDRNSQIMACGGLVLYKYAPMSELVFGDNIYYFNTKEEMLEMVRDMLSNYGKYHQTAKRGYQFAQDNLMVDSRVSQLLKVVAHHGK